MSLPFLKGTAVMRVYKYTATRNDPEVYTESGTIVAQDERAAINILKQESFHEIRLRRLRGLRSLWKRLNADLS